MQDTDDEGVETLLLGWWGTKRDRDATTGPDRSDKRVKRCCWSLLKSISDLTQHNNDGASSMTTSHTETPIPILPSHTVHARDQLPAFHRLPSIIWQLVLSLQIHTFRSRLMAFSYTNFYASFCNIMPAVSYSVHEWYPSVLWTCLFAKSAK